MIKLKEYLEREHTVTKLMLIGVLLEVIVIVVAIWRMP